MKNLNFIFILRGHSIFLEVYKQYDRGGGNIVATYGDHVTSTFFRVRFVVERSPKST